MASVGQVIADSLGEFPPYRFLRDIVEEYGLEDDLNQGAKKVIQPLAKQAEKVNKQTSEKSVAELLREFSFTYNHEIGPTSLKPHQPTSNSGVTIGPGYDLKQKEAARVRRDFKIAKIDDDKIEKFVKAIGLTGAEGNQWFKNASEWMRAYKEDTKIEKWQQELLFARVLVPYFLKESERRTNKKSAWAAKTYGGGTWNRPNTWRDLDHDQKLMIFDFNYNPSTGERLWKVIDLIVKEDWEGLLKHYKRGLPKRDADFKREFIDKRLPKDKPIEIDGPYTKPSVIRYDSLPEEPGLFGVLTPYYDAYATIKYAPRGTKATITVAEYYEDGTPFEAPLERVIYTSGEEEKISIRVSAPAYYKAKITVSVTGATSKTIEKRIF